MEHRIRAALIAVKDDSILLLKHQSEAGIGFWTPPGGELEGAETIFDCAKRKAREETGLAVELGDVIYLAESIDPDQAVHTIEVFILARSFEGTPSTVYLGHEENVWVEEARFVSRDEMNSADVFPEALKAGFWVDLASTGRPEFRYLGQSEGYRRAMASLVVTKRTI